MKKTEIFCDVTGQPGALELEYVALLGLDASGDSDSRVESIDLSHQAAMDLLLWVDQTTLHMRLTHEAWVSHLREIGSQLNYKIGSGGLRR